jgi:hypothetical protein
VASVYGFRNETVNLAAIRQHLSKRRDEALEKYVRAAAFMAFHNDRKNPSRAPGVLPAVG